VTSLTAQVALHRLWAVLAEVTRLRAVKAPVLLGALELLVPLLSTQPTLLHPQTHLFAISNTVLIQEN